MLNKLMIIGNVGHTPEVKEVNGVKVANIQVGVTERGYTTKNGQNVPERTDWFYVQAWRGLAEIIERYVSKGDKLYIEGRMRSRQYDAKDGSKRIVWELVAENIELLTPKNREGQNAPAAQAQQNEAAYEDDTEMPF